MRAADERFWSKVIKGPACGTVKMGVASHTFR